MNSKETFEYLETDNEADLGTFVSPESSPESQRSGISSPSHSSLYYSAQGSPSFPVNTTFSLFVRSSATTVPVDLTNGAPKERKKILKMALDASYAHAFLVADPIEKPEFFIQDVTNLPFCKDLSNERFVSLYDSEETRDQLLYKEYPHLYFVVDKPISSSTRNLLKYLSDQASLSMSISWTSSASSTHKFDPWCVSLATEHFVFLFDWQKLGPGFLKWTLGPIFENESVQKIVRDFEFSKHREWLDKEHFIRFKNLYDVAEKEKELDGHSGLDVTYSLRRLQKKYENSSYCFKTFPATVFTSLSQYTKKDHSIGLRHCDSEHIRELVCEVTFLKLIADLQGERFMSVALTKIEDALMNIYLYETPQKPTDKKWWYESSESTGETKEITKPADDNSDSDNEKELVITEDPSRFLVN